jgi:integrase
VVDERYTVVAPAEEYLEFLRDTDGSANTVKSYARALALWWTFLEHRGLGWLDVELRHFGEFLRALRTGTVETGVISLEEVQRVPDSTVATRMRPVMAFYRFQASNGVQVASVLYEKVRAHPGPYLPFLEHVARRHGRTRSRIRLRTPRSRTPILTPEQIRALVDHEATWEPGQQAWVGDLRYRLMWLLLAETGARLGEVLSLRHGDWHTGRGGTASVRFEPSDHPHGQALKSGPREVHIGARLDRLYGDYVWMLCEHGADQHIQDWDSSYVFVNIRREPLFAPMRPESIYAHLRSVKRAGLGLPNEMTPHWFRHTHATALLLAGVPLHVVQRRLGHRDVQTTLNTYGHVAEDAELAALANWAETAQAWMGVDDARSVG